MGIFEAVKKGFGISTKALGILLIMFVYTAALNIVVRPLQGAEPAAWGPEKWLGALVIIAVAALAGIFFQGGMLGFLSEVIKQGKAGLAVFWKNGTKFFGRLLGLAAILFAMFGIAAIVFSILFALVAVLAKGNTAINIAGITALLIPSAFAFYYLFLLIYSPIVLVTGDTKIFAAMRTSMQFTRKNILKLIGLAALLLLIAIAAGFLVGVLVVLATLAASTALKDAITLVFGAAVNSYFNIVLTSGLVAFYLANSGATAKAGDEAGASQPTGQA